MALIWYMFYWNTSVCIWKGEKDMNIVRPIHINWFLLTVPCQGDISVNFKSSFFNTKYTSLGANLSPESFRETTPRVFKKIFQNMQFRWMCTYIHIGLYTIKWILTMFSPICACKLVLFQTCHKYRSIILQNYPRN